MDDPILSPRSLLSSERGLDLLRRNVQELICEISEDNRYIFMNQAFKKLLGYSEEDLHNEFPLQFLHPEDVNDARRRADEAVPGRPFSSSSRFRDRAGNWRWFDWTAEAILTDTGARRLIVCSRPAAPRDEVDERFRALVTSAPDALIMVDLNGRIELFNSRAEALFGYSAGEALGKPLELLIPPRHRRAHVDCCRQFILETGELGRRMARDLKPTALRRDGTEFPVEISLSRIGGKSDPRVVASVRDISARIQLEEERSKIRTQGQHAQKLESLGTLAGGIAHDLNNMLAAVLNYSNLALSRLRDDPLAAEPIEESRRVVATMAALCNHLTEFAGNGAVSMEPVDLSRAVEDTKSLLSSVVSKKAELRFDLNGELPLVYADIAQLRQILVNLVVNASESLENQQGRIDVRTGLLLPDDGLHSEVYLADSLPDGPCVFVEVSDTGCGMDADTEDRLFDPFFSTKAEGRGLGMSVVLGIVRAHGGACRVKTHPGRGTGISLFLPPGSEQASASVPETRERAEPRRMRGQTILFVEDEGTVRDSGCLLLQENGFTVLVASDGHDACRVFAERSGEIDLVLLDVAMPGLGGEEVSRELHRIQPDVRIILMSGSPRAVALQGFDDLEPADFIQKPYELPTLLEKIEAVIRATASASPRARPGS